MIFSDQNQREERQTFLTFKSHLFDMLYHPSAPVALSATGEIEAAVVCGGGMVLGSAREAESAVGVGRGIATMQM